MPRIWYLYGIDDPTVARNKEAPKLVSSIVSVLGLDPRHIGMVDIRHWDRFIASSPNGILINPMNSIISKRLKASIDRMGISLFMINTYSTEIDPLLEGPGIMRLLPEEGKNATVMADIAARSQADRILLMYDSHSSWSLSLAKLVLKALQDRGIISIATYDFNGNRPLPQAGMSTYVIALTPNAIDRLSTTISGRKDIVGVILGDTSASAVPTSMKALRMLQSWDTGVIVPMTVALPGDLRQEILTHSGLRRVTTLLGVIVSAIQIAYYLLLVNRSDWDSQGFIIGTHIGDEQVDGVTADFAKVLFTRVGLPPTKIVTMYHFTGGDIQHIGVDVDTNASRILYQT